MTYRRGKFDPYTDQFTPAPAPVEQGCLALRLDKIVSGYWCTVVGKHITPEWWNICGSDGDYYVAARETGLLRIDGYKEERKF